MIRPLSKPKKIKYTYDFAIATSPENGGGDRSMLYSKSELVPLDSSFPEFS